MGAASTQTTSCAENDKYANIMSVHTGKVTRQSHSQPCSSSRAAGVTVSSMVVEFSVPTDGALTPLCLNGVCGQRLATLEPSWVNLSFNPRIDWKHGGMRGDCVVGEYEYIIDKYCSPDNTDGTDEDRHDYPSEARLRAADVHAALLPQSNLAEVTTLLPNRTLMVIGDSVMEQFYNVLECRMRRESLELEVDTKFRDLLEQQKPLWMQGTRKMPPKRPHVVRSVAGAPPMRLLFERAVRFMTEDVRAMLQTADVLIVNWGLHYPTAELYEKDLHAAFALFESFVAEKPAHRAVLFRETGAQHFRSMVSGGGGEYEQRDTSAGACSCAPLEDMSVVNRQNRVLREVLASRRYPHVQRLPFYELTRPYWRWHFGNCTNRPTGWGGSECCDCTHFCYSPAMWDAHLHELVRALERSRRLARGMVDGE